MEIISFKEFTKENFLGIAESGDVMIINKKTEIPLMRASTEFMLFLILSDLQEIKEKWIILRQMLKNNTEQNVKGF